MSTPIENNTEELREILRTVNALPDAGNGDDSNSLIATMPIPENQSVVPEIASYVGDVTTEEA